MTYQERLQQFLEVPLADPSQSRRAKMLNILLLGLTILTILIIIVNLIGQQIGTFGANEARLTNIISIFFLLSSVLIYLTNKYRSSQLAAILFLTVVTVGLFYGDTPYETIWGRNMIALAIPILMASLILDPRASFVLAGIIGLGGIGLAYSNNFPPNITGLVLYIALALISWLTTRSLEQAVTDLRAINTELDQRVAARTSELQSTNDQLKHEIGERIQAEKALAAERERLAERVEQRTADIRLANLQLQDLLKVKDEFLAKMSHELRTPLSVILMLTEILQMEYSGKLTNEQRFHITTIDDSGQHLLKLINDILDVAKIQAGQLELTYETVNIETLSQATIKLINPLAENKQIDLNLTIPTNLPLIESNEKRLKQILINLLTNAVKFTDSGGKVGLEICQPSPENIRLIVWDSGIGMNPNNLDKLFEPFVQLDNSTTRQYEGTGLGLTLVKQFTDMLHGTLEVETEIGKGSRFTITLPCKRPTTSLTLSYNK